MSIRRKWENCGASDERISSTWFLSPQSPQQTLREKYVIYKNHILRNTHPVDQCEKDRLQLVLKGR